MKIRFEIKWEIKEKAAKYNPGGKDCKLCSAEKYHILMVCKCRGGCSIELVLFQRF